MSAKQLLDVTVNSDTIEISIGRETLLKALRNTEDWPVDTKGRPCAILDKELLLEEMVEFIADEDAEGITLVHQMFITALQAMIQGGTPAIQEPEDEEGDEGYPSLDEMF